MSFVKTTSVCWRWACDGRPGGVKQTAHLLHGAKIFVHMAASKALFSKQLTFVWINLVRFDKSISSVKILMTPM